MHLGGKLDFQKFFCTFCRHRMTLKFLGDVVNPKFFTIPSKNKIPRFFEFLVNKVHFLGEAQKIASGNRAD